MDFLTRTIGSLTGLNTPYTIGESLGGPSADFASIWSIHNGTLKSDGSSCTLFVFDTKASASRGKLPLAQNMLQKLKRLRLPGILRIVDSFESDSSLIIATERVVPLHQVLNDLSVDAKTWGVRSVIETAASIESQGSNIHGSIGIGSIYVTESGEWVLGGLELTSQVSGNQIDNDGTVLTYASILPGASQNAPPEVVKSGWQITQRLPSSIDSWHTGLFIYEVFNGVIPFSGMAKLPPSSKGNIPSVVLFNIQKALCNANPRQRIKVSKILDNAQASQNLAGDMNEISSSLSQITILTDYQFNDYLDKIITVGPRFPPAYLGSKILPELVRCLETGKGGTKSLKVVIEFGKALPSEDYQRIVSPVLVKLYALPDRAIRLQLLESLPDYIEIIDAKTVSNKIFQHLSTGFSDTEPIIREQSLKSVLLIVDKLSSKQINGELLRLLAKTQNDQIPEIRANTTILLGRIADRFSTSTRSSVLVAAFTRALKDPHVPSRLASLMSLSATAEFFSPQDCASKLMGALCPSLLDKDKSVRDQASITLDMLLTKIRKQVQAMDNGNDAPSGSTSLTDISNVTSKWMSFSLSGTPMESSSKSTSPYNNSLSGNPARTSSAPPVESTSMGSITAAATASQQSLTSEDTWAPKANDDLWDNNDEEDGWGGVDFDDEPEPAKAPVKAAKAPVKLAPKTRSFGTTKQFTKLSLEPTTTEESTEDWDAW